MLNDRGCRYRLVSITAYALAASFIFVLPISILAHNAIKVLFSTDALVEAITELMLLREGIREQLVNEFYTSGWLEDNDTDRGNPFAFLNPQDRFRITQTLFPDDWVKDQVRNGYGIIMEWLESDEPAPELHLDFGPVKQGMLKGGSRTIVEILVNSWPSCSRDQELTMRRALQSESPLNFEFCNPGGDLNAQLVEKLETVLQEYARNIQLEIPLVDIDDSNYLNSLRELKTRMLRLSLWLRRVRLLSLTIIGLIMAFAIRSWNDVGRWWGIPLSVGSLLGFFFVAVLRGVAPNIINQALLDSGNQSGDLDAFGNVIWSLFERVIDGSAAHMFLAFIIGTGLFGITWALFRRRKEQKSHSLPENSVGPPEIQEGDSPSDDLQERGMPSPPPVKPFDPDDIQSQKDDRPSGIIE